MAAFINLKKLCKEHLAGKARIVLVDLLKNPKLAKADQILAIPTVVRKSPLPQKTVIGDLANMEKVLIGLNIQTIKEAT
jgi:circadian clock protein KaiB